MLSSKYSRSEFNEAKKIVEYMTKRQAILKDLYMETESDLLKLESPCFTLNPIFETTELTCVYKSQPIKTIAKCMDTDYYNEIVGKYICVKKALGEDYSKAEEAIEHRVGSDWEDLSLSDLFVKWEDDEDDESDSLPLRNDCWTDSDEDDWVDEFLMRDDTCFT